MKKLIWQFRNWIMNYRQKFTEKFCKASLTIIILIIALLLTFVIILTG